MEKQLFLGVQLHGFYDRTLHECFGVILESGAFHTRKLRNIVHGHGLSDGSALRFLVIVLFSFAFKGPLEGAREDIQSSVIISNCLHDIHETNIKPHIRIAASYITGQHWDGRLDEFASPIMIITSGDNYIANSNDISPSFDTW